MTGADLIAKARRAAEWLDRLSANCDHGLGAYECTNTDDGWQVDETDRPFYRALRDASDRILIAFAEDRGWQDQEQEADGVLSQVLLTNCDNSQAQTGSDGCEADGVKWVTTYVIEERGFDDITCRVATSSGEFAWEVYRLLPARKRVKIKIASGTAPTREEARRQAVEAARGMG